MQTDTIERTIITKHAGSRCHERAISAEARSLVLRQHDRVERRAKGRLYLSLSAGQLARLATEGVSSTILDEARDIVLVALRGRPPRPCICILTAFRRQERSPA